MDAPTWRGAYDRFLILPQGRLNIVDFDFYQRVAERGQPEREIWQFSWGGRKRFDPVWDMVLEGSTGFSGTFGRQVTVDARTVHHELTTLLLDAMELSASESAVVLRASGVLIDGQESHEPSLNEPLALQFGYDADGNGIYRQLANNSAAVQGRIGKRSDHEATWGSQMFTRQQLISLAADGKLVATFTARHGSQADVEHPQPALWTLGPIEQQRGHQAFPVLYEGQLRMEFSARHLDPYPNITIDGRRAGGKVEFLSNEKVAVELQSLPSMGMHLLQLQNANGMFSNDFIFHVAKDSNAAQELSNMEAQPGQTARTLADVLRKEEFNQLIGSWVDADTAGDNYQASFLWKIEDRVLAMTSQEPDKQMTGLVTLNAKNGGIGVLTADSQGSTSLGKWTFADGALVHELAYTSGDGSEGVLSVHYRLREAGKRLLLALHIPGLPDPIQLELQRAGQ